MIILMAPIQVAPAGINTRAPRVASSTPGISPKVAIISTLTNIATLNAARATRRGAPRILPTLMEIATTARPASAAAAPASATKKSVQSSASP